MASKTITVDGIGQVFLSKRRGQRTIRLNVNGPKVTVSQPSWLPFSAGEAFLRGKIDWIKEHLQKQRVYFPGQELPMGLTIAFRHDDRRSIGSRLQDNTLTVLLPQHHDPQNDLVQQYVANRVIKLLRDKGEEYLPRRTAELAEMHGFQYRSVQVRQLKRRWGSCNSKKELVFNLHLMALDPLHIDYVILHELTHTIHMNHSSEFWNHLDSVMPRARQIARVVRRLQP
jgi:predicted metal-dependent hydrolase